MNATENSHMHFKILNQHKVRPLVFSDVPITIVYQVFCYSEVAYMKLPFVWVKKKNSEDGSP